jgi:hypothetical protein
VGFAWIIAKQACGVAVSIQVNQCERFITSQGFQYWIGRRVLATDAQWKNASILDPAIRFVDIIQTV